MVNQLVMTVPYQVPQHDYRQVHGVRSPISSSDEDKRWYIDNIIWALYMHALDRSKIQMALTCDRASLELIENQEHQPR